MAIELYPEMYISDEDGENHFLRAESSIFPEDADWLRDTAKVVERQVYARWMELGKPLSGPDSVVSTAYESLGGGWRWPNPERPLRWKLDKPVAYIPDCGGNNALIDVSDKVKAIIEDMEPGVHNFIEKELFSYDGDFLERRWFVNICTRIETFSLTEGRVSEDSNGHSYGPWGDMPFDVVVLSERIAGRAIWNEYRWFDRPLISDAFVDRLKSAGARGWNLDGNPYGARHMREAHPVRVSTVTSPPLRRFGPRQLLRKLF